MNQGLAISKTKEQITDAGARLGKVVAPGTVLLSFKLSIGKVGIAEVPLYTNEAIAALPIKNDRILDARYLMRSLQAMDLAGGSNRAAMGATLNKKSLAAVQIPLPSLAEQRRIAAILDHADALRAKRRQILAHLNSLTQSIFHDMFSGVSWSSTLGELADVQIGPFGSLLHKDDYVTGGVPVINPMHIQNDELRPDPEFCVSEKMATSLDRYRLDEGDIVLGRRGEMGRAGIANSPQTGMLCGTGSLILRPRGANSRFLHAIVTSPRMREHLKRSSLGATLPNLNATIVKTSPAPKAPDRTQTEFAGRTQAVQQQIAVAIRTIDASDELFASLQSRAFRGEL